jgi:hypothetical protein
MSPAKKDEHSYEGLDQRIRIAGMTLVSLFVLLSLKYGSPFTICAMLSGAMTCCSP